MRSRKYFSMEIATFLVAFFLSPMVDAYVNPPTFSPTPLVAGEPITMTLSYGDCDIFAEHPLDPTAFPDISLDGKVIRVVLFGFHYPDPIACGAPDFTRNIQIGAYPSGTYTVQLVRAHDSDNGFVYADVLQSSIVVGGGGGFSATPLPTNGWWATSLMIVLIALSGLIARSTIPKARRETSR